MAESEALIDQKAAITVDGREKEEAMLMSAMSYEILIGKQSKTPTDIFFRKILIFFFDLLMIFNKFKKKMKAE